AASRPPTAPRASSREALGRETTVMDTRNERRMKTRQLIAVSALAFIGLASCGGGHSSMEPGSTAGSGGGGAGGSGGGGGGGAGGAAGSPTADDVRKWADAYRAAHPGNGGKDWDIISCCGGASRSAASLASDPAAQQLRSICGKDQLPVIPLLAWEY